MSQSNRTSFQKDLIDKYEASVFEYLSVMQFSEIVKSLDDCKYAIQTGLVAITHIFKLAYIATKNASTSAGYCQKGAYCYIEYIEQTHKLSSANVQSIDYVDALTYIYDKTLSDLYAGRHQLSVPSPPTSNAQHAFDNILSVSETLQAQGADLDKCKLILDQMYRTCSALIWFRHPRFTLVEQLDIIGTHLSGLLEVVTEFVEMFGPEKTNDILLFLDTIQSNISGITKHEYMEILTALQKYIKRCIRKNATSTIFAGCLYLKTISPGMTLPEISVIEKWKRPAEDLVKLAFQ